MLRLIRKYKITTHCKLYVCSIVTAHVLCASRVLSDSVHVQLFTCVIIIKIQGILYLHSFLLSLAI